MENTKSCRTRGRAGLAKTLHVLDLSGVYFHLKLRSTAKPCALLQARDSRVPPTWSLVKQYCTRLHTYGGT